MDRKKTLYILIWLFLMTTSLYSQDTTNQEFTKLYRVVKPIYFFGGLDGFGAGVTLFGFADFQMGIPFFQQVVKLKLFLPNSNSSPYISYGVGKQYRDLGGGGESNKWQVVIVGWHFYPFGERNFYEFSLQYPLYEENKKAFYPTVISFSVGVRIF